MSKIAEPIIQQHAVIGEGALWDHAKQVLYWVDILGQKVFVYNPQHNENREFNVGSDVGTVVPRKAGGLMLAVANGFASLDLDTGEVKLVKAVEEDIPTNRFNDGKCDPAGRFWAGTMDYAADAGKGAVYVLDTDFTVRKVIAHVSCSNGIVWTKDQKTMYYIDTPTQQVHRYDYHIKTGAITNKQVAVQISREVGLPDGMAIDMEDRLWIAMCGTGSVCCWDTTTGRLIDTIEVPGAKLTTSCAFGGPDLNELYITSANVGLSADEVREQPNAGALFKIELDVQGSPTYEFNG